MSHPRMQRLDSLSPNACPEGCPGSPSHRTAMRVHACASAYLTAPGPGALSSDPIPTGATAWYWTSFGPHRRDASHESDGPQPSRDGRGGGWSPIRSPPPGFGLSASAHGGPQPPPLRPHSSHRPDPRGRRPRASRPNRNRSRLPCRPGRRYGNPRGR